MNRAELIDNLADRLEKSRKEATEIVDAVVDEIKGAVTKGEKVQIAGFGIFENIARGARTARNPKTGQTVKVKATKVPKFRPASDFKALVSGARKATATKTAKKAPAKKAAPAKKTTTTAKAPAKKTAPAKKATTAKKAPAKKATTTAKKAAPAKKAPAKKATTAKKASAKKATTAKKAPAKKTTAKKATARR